MHVVRSYCEHGIGLMTDARLFNQRYVVEYKMPAGEVSWADGLLHLITACSARASFQYGPMSGRRIYKACRRPKSSAPSRPTSCKTRAQ